MSSADPNRPSSIFSSSSDLGEDLRVQSTDVPPVADDAEGKTPPASVEALREEITKHATPPAAVILIADLKAGWRAENSELLNHSGFKACFDAEIDALTVILERERALYRLQVSTGFFWDELLIAAGVDLRQRELDPLEQVISEHFQEILYGVSSREANEVLLAFSVEGVHLTFIGDAPVLVEASEPPAKHVLTDRVLSRFSEEVPPSTERVLAFVLGQPTAKFLTQTKLTLSSAGVLSFGFASDPTLAGHGLIVAPPSESGSRERRPALFTLVDNSGKATFSKELNPSLRGKLSSRLSAPIYPVPYLRPFIVTPADAKRIVDIAPQLGSSTTHFGFRHKLTGGSG